MKANDVSVNLDALGSNVMSVHTDDIAGVVKRKRKPKRKVWKYVLSDVYRLCHASDRNDAMLAFGTTDHVRVDVCSLSDEFIYSIFDSVKLFKSEYDRRNIFEITFK